MQTTVLHLPAPLRRVATPARIQMAGQFMRFGVVGLFGLVVDTAVVYGTRNVLGLYGAGIVSYILAATGNWLLNRMWTFRGNSTGSARHQWLMFLTANLVGFVLNRGTYALLVTYVAAAAEEPVIATSVGSIAGMFVNFALSRTLVFR